MRILIADDDRTSRMVLAAVLKKSGHEVMETLDGEEAIEALLRPDAPQLAILDWVMPEIDGIEVVRRLRARQTDRPPYLIMLTTRGEKADIISGLDAGANDYLAKPFDSGELQARVEVGRRMIELQAALVASREALAHQAAHDALTGLLNRRAILDVLHKELARSARQGSTLAVGMCDIDHFKRVNDTYGHHAGDDVLCALAGILHDNLREYDSVGRLGGEEFLVVAALNEGPCSETLFERLRARIAEHVFDSKPGPFSVTASIGVAHSFPGVEVDAILEVADTALYRAKEEGRNRVVHDRPR